MMGGLRGHRLYLSWLWSRPAVCAKGCLPSSATAHARIARMHSGAT